MSSLKSTRELIDKYGGPIERPIKISKHYLPYRHKLIPEINVSFDLDKKFNRFNILKSSPLLSRLNENINLICGDHTYEVNKFTANSLLPDFHALLFQECKLTSYKIDTNNLEFDDSTQLTHAISLLANILSCKSVTLTIDNANELLKISEQLHIESLNTFLLKYYQHSYDNIEKMNTFLKEITKYNNALLQLLDISIENYDSTLMSFLATDFFKIDNAPENIELNTFKSSLLTNLIEVTSSSRPYSNEILAKFCKEIANELENVEFFDFSHSNLFFIYELYINDLINKEKLLKSISHETPELFCWFSPELEKYDSKKYYVLLKKFRDSFIQFDKKKKKKKMLSTQPQNEIFSTFENFITNIKTFYENDWKLLKEMRESGSNQTEIAKLIRSDNLNGLQDLLGAESTEQTIIPTIFERCQFLKNRRPYLIEYAAFFGSVNCFKYLLTNTNNIHNSLIYSIAGGCIEIVRICEDQNVSTVSGLSVAIQFSRNSIFEWILDSFDGLDLFESKTPEINQFFYDFDSTYGWTELCFRYGNISAFKTLVERGFDITSNCLNLASKSGNVLLAKLYFALGGAPESSDCLFFAVENGRAAVLEFLLTKYKEKFKEMSMPNLIFNSIEAGHAKVLKILIDSELFDLNSDKTYINRDFEIINNDQFTSNFCDDNDEEESEDNSDDVVFISKKKNDASQFFLQSFINNKEDDSKGTETPLIAAARKGNLDIFKAILEKKEIIDLNAVNKDGMTALMIAVENDNLDIVKELISLKEVDLNVKKGSLTAERIANTKGYLQIFSLLKKEQRQRARSASSS